MKVAHLEGDGAGAPGLRLSFLLLSLHTVYRIEGCACLCVCACVRFRVCLLPLSVSVSVCDIVHAQLCPGQSLVILEAAALEAWVKGRGR